MNRTNVALAALAIAVAGFVAYKTLAPQSGMMGMDHSAMAAGDNSEASKGYKAVMDSMMKGMMMKPSGKPDLDFMQGMVPHHQGAIDMSKVVLQHGKDPEIKTLAENVIKAQESEIAYMNAWLQKADKAALPDSAEGTKAHVAVMDGMMKDMMAPLSGDADVDYVKGMIPHHQAAIDMAKVALQHAKDPEVLKLANDVVKAQESEIAFMTEWLKKKGV